MRLYPKDSLEKGLGYTLFLTNRSNSFSFFQLQEEDEELERRRTATAASSEHGRAAYSLPHNEGWLGLIEKKLSYLSVVCF